MGHDKNKILASNTGGQAGAGAVENLNLPGVFDDPTHYDPARRQVRPARGRPKGAINKRTEELKAWILRRYGDPAANLAEFGTMTIPQLSKALQCSLYEAAKIWRDVQNDLMPYVHSRMPQAVNVSGVPVAPLTINVPALENHAQKTGLVINPINPDTYEDVETPVARTEVREDG